MAANEKTPSAPKDTTAYPTIGFLPEYLPNALLNANSSSSANVTPHLSFNPLIEIKIDPPTPTTDELSKSQFPFFDAKNSPQVPSVAENSNATAPPIHEIDNKTAVTISEKDDILKEFSTIMTKECKIEAELEFQAAKKKIIRLLSNKESRLTTSEKNDFIRQLNDIIKERQVWLKKKDKRNIREMNNGESLDIITLFQLIAIVNTVVQLLLLYFCFLYENKINDGFPRVFVVFALFVILFIIMLQMFFTPKILFYVIDIIFCSIFCIAYLFVLPPMIEIALIKIVMYLMAIILFMQIIVKTYLISMKNRSSHNLTSEAPLRRSSQTVSHRRNNISVKYHSRPSESSNRSRSHQTKYIYKNYHSPISRVPNYYADYDFTLSRGDDGQDDNNHTYEDNNEENNINNDNEGNNFCNDTDYNYTCEDVCGGGDYNNDDDGGDCGGCCDN